MQPLNPCPAHLLAPLWKHWDSQSQKLISKGWTYMKEEGEEQVSARLVIVNALHWCSFDLKLG